MSTRQSRYETVGDGSDEGNSSHWIVSFCQRYWPAGVGERGSGRRVLGGQDIPTLFLIKYFCIEMVLCDLYVKRFDLTKGLLFETFVITVWYKLCRCDHSVLEFKSFSLLINW